jgi:hypothetical protein
MSSSTSAGGELFATIGHPNCAHIGCTAATLASRKADFRSGQAGRGLNVSLQASPSEERRQGSHLRS